MAGAAAAAPVGEGPAEPGRDCSLCPRLVAFREEWREKEPDWHNAPVPTLLPPEGSASVRLLVVGLAPGVRGANRTGRPFTGDYAGDLLYETLSAFGFANDRFAARPDDGLALIETAVTNGVRCVPPENKPTPAEINTCRRFEVGELALFASYHCSRYNTNTGVLTPEMFRAVFAAVRERLDEG